MPNPKTPEVPLIVPPQTPPAVPVAPDERMTDEIRKPTEEIQEESKGLLAKLRAEVDHLIHPQNNVTATPSTVAPIVVPSEIGIVANNVITGSPSETNNISNAETNLPEGTLPRV